MIFMHNLEINNSRSIIKLAMCCIKTAFEKNIFWGDKRVVHYSVLII